MTIRDIYFKYHIMPQLQQHMFRVASVAQVVMSGWKNPRLDRSLVILACLLHDMGNLAKFDLTRNLPGTPILSPSELNHWRIVQRQLIHQYGSEVHQATLTICAELGLNRLGEILNEENELCANSPTLELFHQASDEAIILLYADLRVVPHGISTLKQRVQDLRSRYTQSLDKLEWTNDFENFLSTRTSANLTGPIISKTSAEFLDLTVSDPHPGQI